MTTPENALGLLWEAAEALGCAAEEVPQRVRELAAEAERLRAETENQKGLIMGYHFTESIKHIPYT